MLVNVKPKLFFQAKSEDGVGFISIMICFNLEQKRLLSIKTDVFGHSRLSQVKAGAQSRCIVIIPPCTYSILRYCILTPICSIETISDPRETFVTYINLLITSSLQPVVLIWTCRKCAQLGLRCHKRLIETNFKIV